MAEGSTKVVLAALGGNLMIALTKFVASAMTGSAAMFSEAIHSVVDSGNQLLLLYGIRRARRPPTPQHPFGHGREVYFWSFVVAVLLFGIGAGLSVYDGWHALSNPEPVESPWVNFAVLGFAVLFEGFSWFVALREFRRSQSGIGILSAVHRSKNPSVFVVLLEDTAALVGLLLAGIGLYLGEVTGNPIYDAYIRKVEKRADGKLWNVPIASYPNVSQFWKYDPETYLKQPSYSRTFQGVKS